MSEPRTRPERTAPRRAQVNFAVPEVLVNQMAAAVYLAAATDAGPRDQTELATNAIRRELDRLAAHLNDGQPFDAELGARLRANRRRPRD